MITLYDDGEHKFVVFRDLTPKGMVQTNQAVIVHGSSPLLLDPGGRAVFQKLLAEISHVVPAPRLTYIFFSHQDPDVLGGAASWYVSVPGSRILLPAVWLRFLPHVFPPDVAVSERIVPIPDDGMRLDLGGCEVLFIPAHFLHSPGNFTVYDARSKTLFSGDILASLPPPEEDRDFVEDFALFARYAEPFHKRYMASSKAIKLWLSQVSKLDVEQIVPQHGPILRGREVVAEALRWLSGLRCGLDLIEEKRRSEKHRARLHPRFRFSAG